MEVASHESAQSSSTMTVKMQVVPVLFVQVTVFVVPWAKKEPLVGKQVEPGAAGTIT